MAYQETTTTGYGTRVGNSFKGILTGLAFFIGGTALLWWNEGRAVKTSDANEEAYEATEIVSDISTVNTNLNGKMILASGVANTSELLKDSEFGVTENAIKLRRTVEYYQWVEKKSSKSEDKLGGKEETVTTYEYEKQWVSTPINSQNFKDPTYQGKNLVVANFDDFYSMAQNVQFGAYTLPHSLISQIVGEEKVALNIPAEKISALNQTIKTKKANATATINENVLYLGANSASPEVGDVRITFTKVNASHNVTVWSKVNNNTFAPFIHKNGYSVNSLYMGTKSLDECYNAEEDTNNIFTWGFRILGILFIFLGLKGLFGFVIMILKFIPIFATIANVGVNLVCGVVAAVWSFIIIAIAWFFYRPILAILLLAAAGALIFLLAKRSKAKKNEVVSSNEQ